MVFLDVTEEDQCSKLHALLADLDWKAIVILSESDRCGRIIEWHIMKCAECQQKRDVSVDAQLALMSAERRQWILDLGQQLAERFAAR